MNKVSARIPESAQFVEDPSKVIQALAVAEAKASESKSGMPAVEDLDSKGTGDVKNIQTQA